MTAQQQFEGGTEAYENWIEFSAGGFMLRGDRGQAQQLHQRQIALSGA